MVHFEVEEVDDCEEAEEEEEESEEEWSEYSQIYLSVSWRKELLTLHEMVDGRSFTWRQ